MADIAEAEGDAGAVREWLGRAARAPRDKAWVADGLISDRWAPASPSGELDAFAWRTPDERIAAPAEPSPVEHQPHEPAPPIEPPHIATAPALAAKPSEAPAEAGPAPEAQASQAAAEGPIPIARARAAAVSRGRVMDPASMSPDDPGPQINGEGGKDFRIFASE
jgi:HemY protein